MRKPYEIPEFEIIKLDVKCAIMGSDAEGAAGGGDPGNEGGFGDSGWS